MIPGSSVPLVHYVVEDHIMVSMTNQYEEKLEKRSKEFSANKQKYLTKDDLRLP